MSDSIDKIVNNSYRTSPRQDNPPTDRQSPTSNGKGEQGVVPSNAYGSNIEIDQIMKSDAQKPVNVSNS